MKRAIIVADTILRAFPRRILSVRGIDFAPFLFGVETLIRAGRGYVMNWDTMKGDWKQIKGKVREKWGELTDDELDQVKGRREQFEGLLQKKFGMAKDEVKRQVDEFEMTFNG
jgi:uncharacterized protein YjbJ (UPF0337 family)